MRRIIVATIGLLGLWVGVCPAREVDLTSVPLYTPYQWSKAPSAIAPQTGTIFRGLAATMLDVDHDGIQDLIYSAPNYLAARSDQALGEILHYQTNYPPNCCGDNTKHTSPQIRLCGDLDGDDQVDLVVLGPARDETLWWYWIVDPYSGQVKHKYTLPVGEDVRPDGRWDGDYYLVGSLDVRRGDTDVRALIIGCSVGYDRYGRGVLAIDPRDGSVLWRYHCGPNPFCWNTHIADIDGDGQYEIIFVGRSPENLSGEKINGFSDDETRLFVLDNQGELRWSQFLSESFGNGELAVADLDQDGLPEIITTAHTTPLVWGEIAVWDHQGRNLARLNGPEQFSGVRVIERSGGKTRSMLVTTSDQRLQEYGFGEGRLELRQEAKLARNGHINYVGDFLPSRGQETIITLARGETFVLDKELKPLLVLDVDAGWWSEARVWPLSSGQAAIIWPGMLADSAVVTKAPFPWQRYKPYALGALALGLVGFLWWFRRRPARVDAGLLRETRLNLLENLELSNHGAIAPLRCVRRLTWHLRALQTDLGNNAKVEIRMREAWSECKDSAVPHLRGIIDRAHLAGVGNGDLETVAKAITDIDKHLDILSRNNFQVTADSELADSLEEANRQADAALIRLRAEVATYFRANVAQIAARVQAARALDLSQAEVNFQVGLAAAAAGGGTDQPEPLPPAVGLCDPRELEFVLDNLVGNAIAAMKSSPVKDLRLTWRTADGMIMIDVADTGCGLAEELWERALNSRYSSKPSGGQGLPSSRKYLRKYGGNLSILRSAPGKGAAFRVMLPVN